MNVLDLSRPNYHSYLLRVWREGAQHTWRASLQSAATEQMYHFATLEALFAFLDGHPAAGESRGDDRWPAQ